jgi:tetratricopeptide (TPR) repeat protein
MTDFFISYTAKDVAWTQWIAQLLQSAGHHCVYQAADFEVGHNFVGDIHEGVRTAHQILAILSPDYLTSKWCMEELKVGIKRHVEGETGALVPVMVRTCAVDGLLGNLQYIDLTAADQPAAFGILVHKLKLAGSASTGPVPWPGVPADRPHSPALGQSQDGGIIQGTVPLTPARQSGHWNVPHERNPYFTGRDDLLARIGTALHAGENVALSQTQAITGLGGIGKTSTAVEFCNRHRDAYPIIWWIRSESADTLRADYAALADELQLPGRVANDLAATVRVIKNWLEASEGWLLVFDNAESADAIRDYLPHGQKGHVLITSRARIWDRVAKSVRVIRLDVETAAKFLTDRTESTDLDSARAIARELDGLPLALEHAAAYVRANEGTTLAEWVTLYREEHLRMFDPKVTRPPQEHPESVSVTWNMAFERIQATPFAADILNTIAFYAPNDIPLDLVRPCVTTGSKLDLNAALAALASHSLVERSGDSLSVHRLVQAVTRERMGDSVRKQAIERALEIALAACPEGNIQNDVATWPIYGRLLPHLRAVAESADAAGLHNETLRNVWLRIDFYSQYRLADLVTSQHASERALAIEESIHGPHHSNVAPLVNNLGSVLRALGDLQRAKEAFEHAVRIGEATYGPDHPNVAMYVSNLGLVLRAQRDLQGAKEAYERALRIDEATYGQDHPNVAIRVNNLGSVLQDTGDLQGAKAAYEQALKIGEATYGPDHPQVALYANNLGLVLQRSGNLQGAKQAIERALRIRLQVFGPDHPATKQSEAWLSGLPPTLPSST